MPELEFFDIPVYRFSKAEYEEQREDYIQRAIYPKNTPELNASAAPRGQTRFWVI